MAPAHSGAGRPQAIANRGDAPCNPIRLLSLLFALPALVCCRPVSAATWDIVPTLRLSETYTDNVSLAPDAARQADWVTQLTPGISLAAIGRRLRLNARYTPQLTYYARGQQANQVYQRLYASANAEVAERLLFLDAAATVDQYNISLQGPVTTSNVNTTGNRSTVRTIFVSPAVIRDLGSAARAEARYTYSVLSSNTTSSLSNNAANRIDLRLSNGPSYKVISWDLAYYRQIIDYENVVQPDTDTEVATARARYLITPTVGLVGRLGYEDYHYRIVGPGAGGSAWGAGFEWTPSPRTSLTALAGRRFYGDTYFLDFHHRTRSTVWSIGYSEDITTARSQFFLPATTSTSDYLNTLLSSRFPDPVARKTAADDFIARTGLPPDLSAPINFYTNQLFLLKRGQASLGLLGVRNALIGGVFRDSREALPGSLAFTGAGDFAVSDTVIQTGGSLVWNHQFSARSALNVGGTYSRNEFLNTGRTDRLATAGVSLTHELKPRTSGSIAYRRRQNGSTLDTASYKENSVIASLQVRF
jgi:uncharacterized protein (PEP-CTERM system associated)